MVYEKINIKKCSPHIGAEIGGVDLTSPLTNSETEEILFAVNEFGVVFFREQKMDPESQDRFVRYFGEPHVHVGGKSTASKPVAGYPALRKQHFNQKSPRISGEAWHSDQSCTDIPPKFSVLYQEIIPPEGGGDTMFLSAAKAYEELSQGMKDYLSGKVAFHSAAEAFDASVTKINKEVHLAAEHPVVIKHPENSRKVLYVNPYFTRYIKGIPDDESRYILKFLYQHLQRPNWTMRFKWTDHTVACWDNRAVQHYAIWDYWPHERLGYRMFVGGTERPSPSSADQ
ncbi:MAG: Alpha-ketoglutarate-dependent taurine dioxygenase [Alphaproteobacteria bacterium MarineAlpha11_Bin1]|nr:MAG: Alpha-ketoglutarate-dependent taurine dioxygenase [Alphaproteobacteria bacterium MarineAlpha11_Bin1]|tara:strand:+ start:970 stop:1824 length:855 start_codon:yes stop_codon:yes gene_type:complete